MSALYWRNLIVWRHGTQDYILFAWKTVFSIKITIWARHITVNKLILFNKNVNAAIRVDWTTSADTSLWEKLVKMWLSRCLPHFNECSNFFVLSIDLRVRSCSSFTGDGPMEPPWGCCRLVLWTPCCPTLPYILSSERKNPMNGGLINSQIYA